VPTIDTTSFISPNHNSRGTAVVNLLVLHATVGDALSSLQHLCNPAPINPRTRMPDPDLAVSIHYLIDKRGRIYQLVNESQAAWHAGASRWRDMNSVAIRNGSIGIELENKNDGKDPYPAVQLGMLTWLTNDILTRYPLPLDHIVSHAEIAIPAGRKTDPKGFPWDSFRASLAHTPPPPRPYRVIGLPVYQRADHTGALWGHLKSGEQVAIDDLSNGHLADGRGFVDLAGLEPL